MIVRRATDIPRAGRGRLFQAAGRPTQRRRSIEESDVCGLGGVVCRKKDDGDDEMWAAERRLGISCVSTTSSEGTAVDNKLNGRRHLTVLVFPLGRFGLLRVRIGWPAQLNVWMGRVKSTGLLMPALKKIIMRTR